MPDTFGIEHEWLELKNLIKEYENLDSDIYSFLKKGNKRASKRLRKKFLNIHKSALNIRKNILYQRKENISNYEDY